MWRIVANVAGAIVNMHRWNRSHPLELLQRSQQLRLRAGIKRKLRRWRRWIGNGAGRPQGAMTQQVGAAGAGAGIWTDLYPETWDAEGEALVTGRGYRRAQGRRVRGSGDDKRRIETAANAEGRAQSGAAVVVRRLP